MSKKISYIIGAIYSILSIIIIYIINKVGVLPNKYLIILIAFLIVIGVIHLLITKKTSKKWLILISELIVVVILILNIVVCNYINKMDKFINNIDAINTEITEYYVIIKKTNSYDLENLNSKNIGLIPSDEEIYQKAIFELNNLIKTNAINYQSEDLAYQGLIEEKVLSILVNDLTYSYLKETIEKFEDNIKIIYTIAIENELKNIQNNINLTQESFNIYISGIDTYGTITNKARSDVNIIITVNPVTNEILITSIPRDYYVELPNGNKDKLTHAGWYGINTSVETIEKLLDIKIDYYLRVNFNTLINAIDVIGGITIYSDQSFRASTIPVCSFIKGNNDVNGLCALAFARERYAYATGDRHRNENQQEVLIKAFEKLTSSTALINKYGEILNSLNGTFQTNMTSNEIYSLIRFQLDKMPSWNIETISLNGADSTAYTYSYKSQKLYVMQPYQATIDNAKNKINLIMNGKED